MSPHYCVVREERRNVRNLTSVESDIIILFSEATTVVVLEPYEAHKEKWLRPSPPPASRQLTRSKELRPEARAPSLTPTPNNLLRVQFPVCGP